MSNRALIEEISFESSKSIAGGVLGKILDYVLVLMLARYLEPSGYGVYATGFMLASVLVTLSQFGLKSGMTRFVSKAIGESDEQQVSTVYFTIIGITVILSISFVLAGVVFQSEISAFFFGNAHRTLILLFLLSVPFRTVLTVSLSLFNGYNDMGTRVGVELMRDFLQVLVAAGLVFFEVSIDRLVAGLVSVLGIVCLVTLSLSVRKISNSGYNIRFSHMSSTTKDVLLYSVPLWFVAISNLGMNWADILLLSYFSMPNVVGIYQSAYSVSSGFWVLLLAFSTPFFAMSSRLYTNSNYQQLEEIFQLVTRWINLIMLPVFVFTFMFASSIVSLMFGQAYIGGGVVLQLLLIGSFIHTASGNNVVILKSSDNTRIYLLISAISLILNIILNLILIPSFGGAGASVATSATMGLLNLSTIGYVYYRFGIWGYAPTRVYSVYIISAFSAIIPIFLISEHMNINIILLSLVYMILYLLLIRVQNGLTDIDKEVINIGMNKIGWSY